MTPIAESITLAIVAALEEITVANGYPFTVSTVTRMRSEFDPDAVVDKSANVIERTRAEADPEGGESGNLQSWNQSYMIHLCRRLSDTSSTAIGTVLNESAAAIEMAIEAIDWDALDISPGVATDHRITDIEPIEPTGGGVLGVLVSMFVIYRHPRQSPFVAE